MSTAMKQTAKHAWPQAGGVFWLVAACAIAIVLSCGINSLRWIGQAFPGFLLWENRFVPAVGDTDWSGYEAGVPYGSRVIEMNGAVVTSAREVYRTAASMPVGTAVTYTFAVADAAAPVRLSIPTMRFTAPEYLWTMGNYLAVGTLLALLGLIVYFLRPDIPAAQALLIAGLTWGLYFVTAADIFGPAWFRPLCLVLQAMTPAAVAHLALTFPLERAVVRRHPWLIPTLYGVAIAIGVADNVFFTRWFAAMIAVNRLHALASGIAGALLVGLLVYSLVAPPTPAAGQRTKIAAVGGFAAFFLPIAGAALFSVMDVSFPLNFLALPFALFPVAIGYAIVKHDLFEVDVVIRHTVAWAILTAAIAVLYLGGISTLELVFSGRTGRLAQLALLLLVVTLFNPLRTRVQAAIDYLFARDRYDYRTTVAEASQALAALVDLTSVVSRILRTIADTIHVDLGAVWLRDDGGYRLEAVAGATAALPEHLDGASALVEELEENPQRVLTRNEVGDDRLEGEIEALGAMLVVPMTFERRLTGFLALGEKQSGAFYSTEDLGLLRTLASQGAVAVENARSYSALVRANEELRSAQSRLIEAERLAAIGELSAAVAHGIRNPVAGIKLAAQVASSEVTPGHPLSESIADIIGETNKLEARIKTLLDFAKPFQPNVEPCRIGDIVDSAVSSLRSQMTAQGVELTVDIAPTLPSADLDFAQVEQVVLALLSNAVEAMPGGGKIAVSAHATDDGRIRLDIADNGPGIAADKIGRVFNLFFTTKSSGTGFGLAVAKKIVERHGGTIAVESAVGEGCRFIIHLPATSGTTEPRVRSSQ